MSDTRDQAGDVAALRALKYDDDARTIPEIKAADDWQEGTITEATRHEDGGWSIGWTDERESFNGVIQDAPHPGSLGCGIRAEYGKDLRIAVGAAIRFYGRGFGHSFHGIDIDGREVFWRTPWERFADRVVWLAQHDRDKRERFAAMATALDERVEALPEPLRQRIERFRIEDPKFRMDSEAYEMAAVGDAPKIARALAVENDWTLDDDLAVTDPAADTESIRAAVRAFHAASYDEQRRRVPDLDDGHSGNTFAGAVSLAGRLLEGAEV